MVYGNAFGEELAGIFLYLYTRIEKGLRGFLAGDLRRVAENSPEKLGTLEKGKVGGLGEGLFKNFEHE